VAGYDETTGETTSHLTKLQTAQQVIGYSHSTDGTPSHSTRLSKNDNQVAGYKLAKNASQVAGYSWAISDCLDSRLPPAFARVTGNDVFYC
jgi:hypothetical protein